MPHSIRLRWLVGWLFGVLAFAGCAADPSTTGDLTIDLTLSDGTQIDEVSYAVTGNEIDPIVGTINTSSPGATASVEIYGIPAGEDYEVMLTATSTDGQTSCSGSAEFDVVVGEVTDVMVMLNCQPNSQYGGVRVNGKFNFCADLLQVVVSPLQTSIGNEIDVLAVATDLEGDPIEYQWTGTGGSFADPTAAVTTFTCEALGDQTITITVSDDGFRYCDCSWTVRVTCVDGDGGTGGTGGMGGAGGEGGMGAVGGTGGMGGVGGTGGMGGVGGTGGMGGAGGTGGMGGVGGEGGMGGAGGEGGMGGAGGEGGMGGVGGEGGMGGVGGEGGMGGTGGCIPDKGAQYAGPANRECAGTEGCGELEVCVDGACEEAALVFVSSELFTAALEGPRGADQICAELAREAGLGGYWMSWTSDECTSPQKRFHRSEIEYRLINGDQVAADWNDLIDSELDREIRIDENGVNLTTNCVIPGENDFCFVWTNTTVQGFVHFNNGCRGLTSEISTDVPALSGQWTRFGLGWTAWQTKDCGQDLQAIYCFEQPASNQ